MTPKYLPFPLEIPMLRICFITVSLNKSLSYTCIFFTSISWRAYHVGSVGIEEAVLVLRATGSFSVGQWPEGLNHCWQVLLLSLLLERDVFRICVPSSDLTDPYQLLRSIFFFNRKKLMVTFRTCFHLVGNEVAKLRI